MEAIPMNYSDYIYDGNCRLYVIGGGKMAQAMCEGFVKKGCFRKENISICCKTDSTLQKWKDNGYVKVFNVEDFYSKNMMNLAICLIAVKPQILNTFVNELNGNIFSTNTIFVSILGGISCSTQNQIIGRKHNINIIHLMPNICCEIGSGTSLVTCDVSKHSSSKINIVIKMAQSLGHCEFVSESIFNAAASISACAPAYIFTVIEALIDGGVLCGLPQNLASRLVSNMVAGSGQFANSALPVNAAELKGRVCSPGGTTIAGIRELEKANIRSAFIEAIAASTHRANEISNEAEKTMI